MDKLNELVEMAKASDGKWFATAINPESILAIAEAFRELEQRAEAAEAKLAELAKQEPAEYQYYYHNHGAGAGEWLSVTSKLAFEQMKAKHAGDNDFSFRELFTRPVPAAINLAELVPPMKDDSIHGKNDSYIDSAMAGTPAEPPSCAGLRG